LKDLRDLIVHAKPIRLDGVLEHSASEEPAPPRSPLRDVVTHENAERARDDVQTFADTIHAAALLTVKDIWFGKSAFGGTFQYSSSHTTIAT
jgi:hypothetical protein